MAGRTGEVVDAVRAQLDAIEARLTEVAAPLTRRERRRAQAVVEVARHGLETPPVSGARHDREHGAVAAGGTACRDQHGAQRYERRHGNRQIASYVVTAKIHDRDPARSGECGEDGARQKTDEGEAARQPTEELP